VQPHDAAASRLAGELLQLSKTVLATNGLGRPRDLDFERRYNTALGQSLRRLEPRQRTCCCRNEQGAATLMLFRPPHQSDDN